MQQSWRDQEEWLEADGLGGFASGTGGGIRTRRYHGLLVCATAPPTGRFVLVNGFDAFVTTPAGTYPLSTQRYQGQAVAPEGFRFIESFETEPWPTWRYRLPDGTRIEQELFMRHGQPTVAISWRLVGGASPARLSIRPLVTGRDYHALHHENGAFDFTPQTGRGWVRWRPYAAVPGILAQHNGDYFHEPLWYRQFLYQEEWLRGFDTLEDCAAPGRFEFDLSRGEATLTLSAQMGDPVAPAPLDDLRQAESRRRSAFASPLHRAADQYLVKRGSGKTIIAGYPWFADWGRDTFISLRGLCLAGGRLDDAEAILTSWAGHVSEGMLPNRFPDFGDAPEYNSVDASLWYVIAVCEFLQSAGGAGKFISIASRQMLIGAMDAILTGYSKGTRHGIALDDDGLLRAGESGVQLTWMDAKVGDRVITPRIGKPVEVQALWLNALWLASSHLPGWEAIGERGAASFRSRFWNEPGGYLYDVVDDNHVAGANDASFRPNQIFAVGGLPLMLIDQPRARRIVEQVQQRLLTPQGLRSLAPLEPGYCDRYRGGPAQRDGAYHQGTVWPWLIGPFVEAWIRVHGSTSHTKRVARQTFIEPLLRHLGAAGLGHVSEIADAEAPHQPRGCPFQAWSIAELLRLERFVLADERVNPPSPAGHPSVVPVH